MDRERETAKKQLENQRNSHVSFPLHYEHPINNSQLIIVRHYLQSQGGQEKKLNERK